MIQEIVGIKISPKKVKLLQLKLIHLFVREVLLVKQLEIEETKTTYRAVFSRGAEGALAPPEFGSSVNPIPTKGGTLCLSITASTPGLQNLTTALYGDYFNA